MLFQRDELHNHFKLFNLFSDAVSVLVFVSSCLFTLYPLRPGLSCKTDLKHSEIAKQKKGSMYHSILSGNAVFAFIMISKGYKNTLAVIKKHRYSIAFNQICNGQKPFVSLSR